jgi:hypothetical protein
MLNLDILGGGFVDFSLLQHFLEKYSHGPTMSYSEV